LALRCGFIRAIFFQANAVKLPKRRLHSSKKFSYSPRLPRVRGATAGVVIAAVPLRVEVVAVNEESVLCVREANNHKGKPESDRM